MNRRLLCRDRYVAIGTNTGIVNMHLFWDRSGIQRQFRSSGERHEQCLLPWSLPTKGFQNPLLLLSRSTAVRRGPEAFRRFDRARSLTPSLPPSSLAIGHGPARWCSPVGSVRVLAVARFGVVGPKRARSARSHANSLHEDVPNQVPSLTPASSLRE